MALLPWLLVSLLGVSPGLSVDEDVPIVLPQRDPVILQATAQLGPGPAKENSGIVASRTDPHLYWMHNDSGDEPRIYPVRRDGSVVPSRANPDQPGILIIGASNRDWEDLAIDSAGRLILADFGNNSNARTDLKLYYVDEPDPQADRAAVTKVVRFRYPDQTAYPAPAEDFNYDSEAIFTIGERVYILTKHRSDTATKLYRLDEGETDPDHVHTLTLLDRFPIGGQVTGADSTPDGRRVVVVTYEGIWLFDSPAPSEEIFTGSIHWLPYQSQQVEAICFANASTLLLADEARAVLFEVEIADLIPLQTTTETER